MTRVDKSSSANSPIATTAGKAGADYMKDCRRCHGRGWVIDPRATPFMVQLKELDRWSDYIPFATRDEAVARAVETGWGPRARVRKGRKVVYEGLPEHDHYNSPQHRV